MVLSSREFSGGCSRYRIEVDTLKRTPFDERRRSEEYLARLMMSFNSSAEQDVRDTLLAVYEALGGTLCCSSRQRHHLPWELTRQEVGTTLQRAVWFGDLTIRRLEVDWSALALVHGLPRPPPSPPPARREPRREPVALASHAPRNVLEPAKKTWFAAQFVDESGLWIDGLAVELEVPGAATHRLTTDAAGVVKVTDQTASISLVSVADLAQAEQILVSRLDNLEKEGAPEGKDVINYPLVEPAQRLPIPAECPWTIVLGLQRTWFEVRVVDECGVAVEQLDMRFAVHGGAVVTTDGAGVARLETHGDPPGSVTLDSVGQARGILAPRWDKARKPLNLGGPQLSTHQLTDSFPAVPLTRQRRHTIVLTPEQSWIEIRVVDDTGNPITDKRVKLHLTDGNIVDTMLGSAGLLRADEIPAGRCKLELPVSDRAEWIDPNAPLPEADSENPPEGRWIVRKDIAPPGPEVTDLRTGQEHVVVVGRKVVEQLELDDALFRLMSAVLLPEGQSPGADPTEPDGTRPTTLDLLAASLRYAELHPDRKTLITGHTDTSGGDQYNQNLSEFRAAAVHAVLSGDDGREEFGDICHGPHIQGKQKKQEVMYDDRVQVLNWVAATFGWSCATSGEYGSYLRAVKGFQSSYNEHGNAGDPKEKLDVDGDFGPASWRAVFDCYQVHLAETLEMTPQELASLQAEVRGRFLKPFVGCGEYKPLEQAGRDNYRSQTNRRVEVLFFEPGHEPQTPCLSGECDPEACELYDRRWYLRKRLPATVQGKPRTLRLQLLDQFGQQEQAGLPYKLEIAEQQRTGTTLAGGRIEEPDLEPTGTCIVRWGRPVRDDEFPCFAEIHLDADARATDDGCVERRYWNLGYWSPLQEENARCFHNEYGAESSADSVHQAHCLGIPKLRRGQPGPVDTTA